MATTKEGYGTVHVPNKPHHPGPRSRDWKPKLAVASTLSLLAFLNLRSNQPTTPNHVPDTPTSPPDDPWATIPPNRTLTWHSCYTRDANYTCARLDLPMDWLTPSTSDRIILAIIRLHATTPTTDPDYRGPVIFNPGGPGGSGIASLLDHGHLVQTIVGKNHDIISFDPRGVGASVPRIECWDSPQSRAVWDLQSAGVGVIGSDAAAVYQAYARAEALSAVCADGMGGGDGLLGYSSTASHARDMLAILDGMGEDRLKYWGFSYGTVLGGVFASMYPDRVGRMVSDGNVDYEEWFGGEGSRINSIRDADKVMDAFYTTCHTAGRERCDFWASTPGDIRRRLDDLMGNLTMSPVIVSRTGDGEGPGIPEIITTNTIIRLLSTALYQPILTFPSLATSLSALERRDGGPLYKHFLSSTPTPSTLCTLPTIPPPLDTEDAFSAIYCSDSTPFTSTPAEYMAYASRLIDISTTCGAEASLVRLSCAGRLSTRPKWRFAGPFGGETQTPILFIANVADNVTPLASARNNSAVFPGSRVLVQRSYGHTSLAAPSSCTARWIRRYFQNGDVPGEGTVCEADLQPFGEGEVVDMGMGDDEMRRAVWELAMVARWGFGAMGRPL